MIPLSVTCTTSFTQMTRQMERRERIQGQAAQIHGQRCSAAPLSGFVILRQWRRNMGVSNK